MAIVEVKVPQFSESVSEGTMLQWKKKPGEAVTRDEILVEIETDKVVLEVPAPDSGVMAEIIVADGGFGDATPVAQPVRSKRQRLPERSPATAMSSTKLELRSYAAAVERP